MRFLGKGLRAHNEKAWFDAHRDDYERVFLAPALAFAEALGPRLRNIELDVNVEPRVNGSLMRINRDIRFSKDKSPYKDHMDLWFWTGRSEGLGQLGLLLPAEGRPAVARRRHAPFRGRRAGALPRGGCPG